MGRMTDDLLAIPVRRPDGSETDLGDCRGKVLLIVNTASECGFTPQYAGLEHLWRKYGDRGFAVLAFPCNQFGRQEPGSAEEIARFCADNYGVSFPIFGKVDVNGGNSSQIYRALKHAAPGLLGTESIKWNFTKFLVDRAGRVVRRYGPATKPEAIDKDIAALLGPER